MKITITTRGIYAEVVVEESGVDIRTKNYLLYRSLRDLFDTFFKKGIEMIASSHGVSGKQITLERKVVNKDDPDFEQAVIAYLGRAFGTENVTVNGAGSERQELKNQIRHEVNQYRTEPSVRGVIPAINTSVEKLSVNQLKELMNDLK
ncbi:MAG: hypothetical protein V1685_06105 [Parcubacteria group bacterium]